jgi:hypothetical protein
VTANTYMKKKKSIPGAFIIESNQFEDEDDERIEGRVLKEMLVLSGRPVKYRYIRTKQEFKAVLGQFRESRFRYLHLACHGTNGGFALTMDTIRFADCAKLLIPVINKRRLFISACDGSRRALADPLFAGSTCYSVIGPRGDISFPDAAIAWASFYSAMSKVNDDVMKRADIEKQLGRICKVFGVRFNAFFPGNGRSEIVVLGEK